MSEKEKKSKHNDIGKEKAMITDSRRKRWTRRIVHGGDAH